jgi:hypothetical protein
MGPEYVKGDRVKVVGERGAYVVHRSEPGKDGSILLYGGDVNPNGVRNYRSIMPARLERDKRKVTFNA